MIFALVIIIIIIINALHISISLLTSIKSDTKFYKE